MKKKKVKRWFHVIVECHSTERFTVQAKSEKAALRLYEAGHAELRDDEVESRDVVEVIDRGAQ